MTAIPHPIAKSSQSPRVWFGPVTHILAGLLPLSVATAYGLYTPSIGTVALAVILSLLADVDSGASLIGRWLPFISSPLESRFGHRTITHSWVALAVVGFVAYAIFPASWVWLLAAYASHLVIDMLIGEMGIPLFWPNPTHFQFAEIEPGGNGEFFIMAALAVGVIVPQFWQPGIPYLQDTSFEDAIIQYQEHDGFYRSYAQLEGTTTDSHVHIAGRFQVDSLAGSIFTLTCIELSPCEYLPYRFTADKTGHADLRVIHIELIQGEAFAGATLTPTITATPSPTTTPTVSPTVGVDYSIQIALLRWQRIRHTPGPEAALAYLQYCQVAQISPCETPIPTITPTRIGTPTATPELWLQRMQTKQARQTNTPPPKP